MRMLCSLHVIAPIKYVFSVQFHFLLFDEWSLNILPTPPSEWRNSNWIFHLCGVLSRSQMPNDWKFRNLFFFFHSFVVVCSRSRSFTWTRVHFYFDHLNWCEECSRSRNHNTKYQHEAIQFDFWPKKKKKKKREDEKRSCHAHRIHTIPIMFFIDWLIHKERTAWIWMGEKERRMNVRFRYISLLFSSSNLAMVESDRAWIGQRWSTFDWKLRKKYNILDLSVTNRSLSINFERTDRWWIFKLQPDSGRVQCMRILWTW